MKLFTTAIILVLCITTSFGQINPDFLKSKEFNTVLAENFELPDFNSDNYSLRLPSLVLGSTLNDMMWCPIDNINPPNELWLGESQTKNFMINNLKVNTLYQFDVNGRFRGSSMSIKLN